VLNQVEMTLSWTNGFLVDYLGGFEYLGKKKTIGTDHKFMVD
jgi:hypothetical protein